MTSPDPATFREQLGLKSRSQWLRENAFAIIRRNPSLGVCIERSGRTTEMLLEALTVMAKGEQVVIDASSLYQAKELRRKLREWACMVGVDPDLVVEDRPGFRGRVFQD